MKKQECKPNELEVNNLICQVSRGLQVSQGKYDSMLLSVFKIFRLLVVYTYLCYLNKPNYSIVSTYLFASLGFFLSYQFGKNKL